MSMTSQHDASGTNGASSAALSPTPQLAPRRQYWARLVAKQEVTSGHFEFRFSAEGIGKSVYPGQFVHVMCREPHGPTDPFLRRAFSIMRWSDHEISILFRVEGKGTQWLSRVEVDEYVDILAPLGQPFHLPHHSHRHLFYVGGGVGVPPMVALATYVSRETIGVPPGQGPLNTLAIVGARSAAGLIGLHDFQAAQVPHVAVTEDGSSGVQGRVTDVLRPRLQDLRDKGEIASAIIYACGPLPMLKAVAALCQEVGARCQVSLEENMPCGVGVCNGCVVPSLGEDSSANPYERYQRICVQGPVMDSRQVDWEALCH